MQSNVVSDHDFHNSFDEDSDKLELKDNNSRKKVDRILNVVDSGSGNGIEIPNLPIEKYKEHILATVKDNPITIITAETGAGKSTQVPQYLLDEGYEVIVTQPRRLAARSVADRISKERGVKLGGEVGFNTAFERKIGRNTRLLFCTDGLQLVKELTGNGLQGKKKILILDEVHEWNTNMETLVAWSKKQIDENDNFRVVLMSATLDAEKLSGFFENDSKSAPTIDVPGKLYPVEERDIGSNQMIQEISHLIKDGRNVLVFQPGKKEIMDTIAELKDLNLDAEILPLHGMLEPFEQQKVFKHYNKPKVVISTNVAQTSITIDDIDAVVDSGVERRIEIKDGVEGLYLKNISQADCKQRKGRAGRCRPGIYTLCSDVGVNEREKFPKPEIQRVRLDQMVLRLATSGLDATKLDFFHQPDRSALSEAKRALSALGAMDANGDITKIGRQISKLPIDVHTGRMVIEAVKNNCVDEVLTVAACLSAGSLRDRTDKWRGLISEDKSDILAEFDLYNKCRNIKSKEMRENGIFAKNYFRSTEIRRHLSSAIQRAGLHFKKGKKGIDREAILRSVVSGMVDHLYSHYSSNSYSRNGEERLLGKESVIKDTPDWIVGIPKDIQFKNRRGNMQTLSLLTMCSEVDPEWLIDVAPQLVEKKRRNLKWSNSSSSVAEDEYTLFNGSEVNSTMVEPDINDNTVEVFYQALLNNNVSSESAVNIRKYNNDIRKKIEELWIRSGGGFKKIGNDEEMDLYRESLGEHRIISMEKFDAVVPNLVSLDKLKFDYDEILPPEMQFQIEHDNPIKIQLLGKYFDVDYLKNYGSDTFFARVEMKLSDVINIQSSMLENIIPSGRKIFFRLDDIKYPDFETSDINDMKEKVESYRLRLKWDEFIKNNEDDDDVFHVTVDSDLPKIPEVMIYDDKANLKAYPAYYHDYGEYYIKWFKSAESADESTKYVLDKKMSVEIEHYYNELMKMLDIVNDDLGDLSINEKDYILFRNEFSDIKKKISDSSHDSLDIPKELMNQVTDLQLRINNYKANKIQEEILESERLNEQKEKLIKSIVDNIKSVNGQAINLSFDDIDYNMLCGSNGIRLEQLNTETLVDWSGSFSDTCEGRDAQLVLSKKVLDGYVDFLVYEKWGDVNINMRFSKIIKVNATEEDSIVEPIDAPINNIFAIKLLEALGNEPVVNINDKGELKKKKKKKDKEKANFKEIDNEIFFRYLNDMTDDEIYSEYDDNERIINEIITNNPELDLLFEQLHDAEEDFNVISLKLEKTLNSRDRIELSYDKMNKKDIKKKKAKIKDLIDQFRSKKKSLNLLIKDLNKKVKILKDVKNRLDAFRGRQADIEAVL